MAEDFWDTLELVILGRNVDDEVIDYTDTTEDGTKVVKTMGRARKGRGFKSGTTMHTFELTVETPVSPRVNWRDMVKRRVIFQFNARPNKGGKLEQYVDCRAISVTRSASDGDGNHKVRCVALDHR